MAVVEILNDWESWQVRCPCGQVIFYVDEHTDVAKIAARWAMADGARISGICDSCGTEVSNRDPHTFGRYRAEII